MRYLTLRTAFIFCVLAIAGSNLPAAAQHACSQPVVDEARKIPADQIGNLSRSIRELQTTMGVQLYFAILTQNTANDAELVHKALDYCPGMRVGYEGVTAKSLVIVVALPLNGKRKVASQFGGGFRTISKPWMVDLRNQIIPYFGSGDYAGGFKTAIDQIRIAETPPPPPFKFPWLPAGITVAIIILLGFSIRWGLRSVRTRRNAYATRVNLRTELAQLIDRVNILITTQLNRHSVLAVALADAGFAEAELTPHAANLEVAEASINAGNEKLEPLPARYPSPILKTQELLTAEEYRAAIIAYSEVESKLRFGKGGFDKVEAAIKTRNERANGLMERLEITNAGYTAIRPLVLACAPSGQLPESIARVLKEVEKKLVEASQSAKARDWERCARRLQKAEAKLEAAKEALNAVDTMSADDFAEEVARLREEAAKVEAKIREDEGGVRHTAKSGLIAARRALVGAKTVLDAGDEFTAYFRIATARKLLKDASYRSVSSWYLRFFRRRRKIFDRVNSQVS